MHDDISDASFLAGSPSRLALLGELRGARGLTERELRERVEGSRTTVHRNLDKLCERDWVRNSGGQYSITTAGECVFDQFGALLDTIETASRLQPFLEYVSSETLDLEIRWLRDAELTTAESGNPLAMVNRHIERIEDTSTVKALMPIAGLHPHKVTHKRMLRGEIKVDCVATPRVAETLLSDPDFADLTVEMIETGRFELSVYDGEIPYYLGVHDDRVEIGVDDDETPKAFVEATSEQVYEWAQSKYAQYESAAEPRT
jgi:predicted transcriptional regulator